MSLKKVALWFFILSIMAIAVGWWLFKKEPVPPPPNHYAEFLASLKEMGWQHPDANKPGNCSVSGPSADPSSPPSTAECELRNLQSAREIAGTLNDLQNVKSKGNLSVSLMFVPSSDRQWLEKDFTDFAGVSGLSDIVAKRNTLRKLFDAFVANSSNALDTQCRLDSRKRPYLTLACRIAEEAKRTTTQLLQKSEWDALPFFSKNDVLRVKSLSNVADTAKELKVIADKRDATLLEKLCLLAKEQEFIQSGIAYEMKEGKVDDADVKKMTEAVLKFVGEVKTIANCP
jgi:hypothetical protein